MGARAAGVTLIALVVLGGALRFSTLGVQDLWLDEAVTQGLVRMNVHDMLVTLSESEATPPLYYLVARSWVVVFGSGEAGLRSLSALVGTLTIPVAYAIGTTLASRKVGLLFAGLVAVSPALVWYSQEARAYALLVLFSALSLLFMARALRDGGGRALGLWALSAMLALLTHYFAAFLIAVEGVWLLAAVPDRRRTVLAAASVGLVGLALLPLALHQSQQVDLSFIDSIPLSTRLVDVGELMLVGPTGELLDFPAVLVVLALVLAALALLVRERRPEVVVAASLAAGATALPVLLALAGADYVLGRNLLAVWLPLAVVVAMGRAALVVALAVASLALVIAVPLDPALQREAITAKLLPGQQDAEDERIMPRVTYEVAHRGRPASAAARCPERYRVDSGGAAWLSEGADRPMPERSVRGGPHGWAATALADQDGVMSVYAICVRPRD